MTDGDQWDRLFDAFDERLDRVGGDPIEECERIYAEAYEIRNVRIAAMSAVMIAELLQRADELGLGAGGADELSNKSLARHVQRCLLAQRSIVTVDEAAALMRCTPQHVRRLARQGHISGRRHPDGSWRCSAASVTNYRRRRKP